MILSPSNTVSPEVGDDVSAEELLTAAGGEVGVSFMLAMFMLRDSAVSTSKSITCPSTSALSPIT
jgi:hypothetical protein